MKPYDPSKIESKWQKAWARNKTYKTKDSGDKFYILDMFPYPSGEGLHVGHPKGYIATDSISRMKRMQGKSVLHPMGFDAFGLPAENYALKTKTNPQVSVAKNVARYKKQLEILGLDYDWSREVNTTDPKFYRWTQWAFVQMLKKGLAYESYEPINWCPSCKTGLANEDIEDGRCERCGTVIEKKPMRQWVLRITDYADRLLADLDATDYVMPKLIDKVNPHQPGKPIVRRSVAHAIVYDPAAKKYLIIRNKKHGWDTVVIGGVEGNESIEETARREVREETGYTDLEFKRILGGPTEAQYYTKHKGENRIAIAQAAFFELKSHAKTPLAAGEDADNEILWVDASHFVPGTMVNSELPIWLERLKDPTKGWGKKLLDWPESIKESQRNWIGRSEGVNFKCVIKDLDIPVEMYNSVPQSYHAETFTVIAPEHPLVSKLVAGTDAEKEVLAFVEAMKAKKALNKFDIENDIEGIFTGRYIKSFADTGRDLPIWVASYVLADYGTGIVNASAHDSRDFAFAKKYGIPLRPVTFPADPLEAEKVRRLEYAHTRDPHGIIMEPEKFKGRKWLEAREDIINHIVDAGLGSRKVNYKLRDWVFSRQRYWGEPIPVIHCPSHGSVPVPEKDLPVLLPKVKSYEPTGTGESPLAAISKWVNTKCPVCVSEHKKPKYFIFDFDGVLGDTWDASVKGRIAIGTAKDEADSLRIAAEYFSKKPHHARNHTMTPAEAASDLAFVHKLGSEMARIDFSLFEGFIKEVKKFKNAQCAVVSSGAAIYVKPKLKKSGIKFSHVLSYEDHTSKEEKIERICKDWNVSVKDIYYFTDTKADVFELENLLDRAKIIGCAWGYSGVAALKEVLPERQILKDFKDIHRFFNSSCSAQRETNTMPQWAGSSWYYLRYMDPENAKALVDAKKERHWSSVDLYVGGAEHATRHLIYARFWHKFLLDIGAVTSIEPFTKLQSVGLIMGEDGRKMSKRFGNVVNPDDIVKTFGADTLRVYEMFMGPFDQQIAWSTSGMVGSRRFIERVWKLSEKVEHGKKQNKKEATDKAVDRVIHKAIKKVSDDVADMKFNTAISALMIAVNELEKAPKLSRTQYEALLKLVAPFAPHMTEELWASLGNKKSIHISAWPTYDAALATDDEATIIVQVNGKVRGTFMAAKDASQKEIEGTARAIPAVAKWLEGKSVKKVIVVPGRLVNFVIAE